MVYDYFTVSATTTTVSAFTVSATVMSTTQESAVGICSVALFEQLDSNKIVANKKIIFFIFDLI